MQGDYDSDDDTETDQKEKLSFNDIVEQELDMVAITQEQLSRVENKLTALSHDIKERLQTRVKLSPMVYASVDAFHSTEWYENAIDEEDKVSKANERMTTLLDSIVPV